MVQPRFLTPGKHHYLGSMEVSEYDGQGIGCRQEIAWLDPHD